ncbi:MAG: DNA repair protein RadC [Planctomycetes bacterium]|nr:DNA repair protein RadC [Planctomycetota bacterium]
MPKDRKKSFTIRDLPASERPRERLQNLGAENLSAQELLAIILGQGTRGESVMVTAQRLLSEFGNLQGIADASFPELKKVKGIGPAKAAQIRAAFTLNKKLNRLPDQIKSSRKNPVLCSPDTVNEYMKTKLKDKKKEHFYVIMLNSRNKIIKDEKISEGTLNASLVEPREVFRPAIKASAAAVIFVHNHPSGDPSPSDDDLQVTRNLMKAAKIFKIDVLDHVIVGKNDCFSMKKEKLI